MGFKVLGSEVVLKRVRAINNVKESTEQGK